MLIPPDGCEAWLISEFCGNDLFNGWHIYLRDSPRLERNRDGGWGWLQRGHWLLPSVHAVLAGLGIAMRPGGDGSCDDDGYAALAHRHALGGSDRRGGVRVRVDRIHGVSLVVAPC